MQYVTGLFLDERETEIGKSAADFAWAQNGPRGSDRGPRLGLVRFRKPRRQKLFRMGRHCRQCGHPPRLSPRRRVLPVGSLRIFANWRNAMCGHPSKGTNVPFRTLEFEADPSFRDISLSEHKP